MSNRTIYFLTFFVLVGITVLLVMNTTNVFNMKFTNSYISRKDVRGSALFHQGKEYTLNFAQQNALIDFINQSEKQENMPAKPITQSQNDIEKVVIYLFNQEEVEILPLGYANNNLIFTAKKWNPNGYFIDTSNGQLKELLLGAFDK